MVDERVGVDQRAPADVHDERAVGQRRQERVIHDMASLISTRQRDDHDLGVAEKVGQLVDRVHRHPVLGACGASDRGEQHLESCEPRGDRLADSAEAQAAAHAGRRGSSRRPVPSAPRPGRARRRGSAAARRAQGNRELRGRGLVHGRGIREPQVDRAACPRRPRSRSTGSARARRRRPPAVESTRAIDMYGGTTMSMRSRGAGSSIAQTMQVDLVGERSEIVGELLRRDGDDQRRDAAAHPFTLPARCASRVRGPAIRSPRAVTLVRGGGRWSPRSTTGRC